MQLQRTTTHTHTHTLFLWFMCACVYLWGRATIVAYLAARPMQFIVSACHSSSATPTSTRHSASSRMRGVAERGGRCSWRCQQLSVETVKLKERRIKSKSSRNCFVRWQNDKRNALTAKCVCITGCAYNSRYAGEDGTKGTGEKCTHEWGIPTGEAREEADKEDLSRDLWEIVNQDWMSIDSMQAILSIETSHNIL